MAPVHLNPKQFAVISDRTTRNWYVEGGWGSGKTFMQAHKAIDLSNANPSTCAGMMVTLTNPVIKTVLEPEMEKAFRAWGVSPQYNATDKLYVWNGGRRIWMRTAEHPKRLEGPTLAFVITDETGQMNEAIFGRLSSRARDKTALFRQRVYCGRPEGTRTWFNRHIQAIIRGQRPNSKHIRLSTLDNPHNADDYVQDILDITDGDEALRRQVVDGEASDESGNIYGIIPQRCIQPCERPQQGRIVVGADFNIDHMATPIGSWNERAQTLHIFAECVSAQVRFPEFKKHPGFRRVDSEGALTIEHALFVVDFLKRRGVAMTNGPQLRGMDLEEITAFTDASGSNRNRTARTDNAMMRDAGFRVKHDSRNPDVRDRIAAVRLALKRGRLLIDPVGAPVTLAMLQGHARDKGGEPQKMFGSDLPLDHWADALGYMVWGLMPIRRGANLSPRY